MRTSLLALALCACATTGDDLSSATDDATGCVRVEGAAIGQRVTVEVPSIDATMPVTFTSWLPKQGDPTAHVGFSLDVHAWFIVAAGYDTFITSGSMWRNPFGDAGPIVKPIAYVELCGASPDDHPAPAASDGE